MKALLSFIVLILSSFFFSNTTNAEHLIRAKLDTESIWQTADTLFISKLQDKQWLNNYPKKGLSGTKFEYICFNDGSVLQVGEEIIIGIPSSSKQTNEMSVGLFSSKTSTQSNFSFIMMGRMGLAALGGTSYLQDSWRGDRVIISSIIMYQDRRGGNVNIVVKQASGINIDLYATILDVEKALDFGEIINPKATLTSDQALAELKKAKDKLDLGLITQEEYEKIKSELSQYIK
jgi:hypothetical protein